MLIKKNIKKIIYGIIFISIIFGIGYYSFNTNTRITENSTQKTKNNIKKTTINDNKNSQENQKSIEKIKEIMIEKNLNGVVMSTTKTSDEPLFISNGLPNYFSKKSYTNHTLFPIASFEKLYTAIIIDKLIQKNKLTLNTKLNNFYPNIRFANKITIQNLLSHTSGIQTVRISPTKVLTNEDSQLEFNKRTIRSTGIFNWYYSSANYALLSGIITKLTKESYQNNVKSYIFKPLKLKHSYFYNSLPKDANIAYPKDKNTSFSQALYLLNTKRIISADYGAGDMFQSVGDFYKILTAFETNKLIKKDRLNIFLPTKTKPYTNGMYLQYGLLHAAASNLDYHGSYYANNKNLKNTVILTTNGKFQTIKKTNLELYNLLN